MYVDDEGSSNWGEGAPLANGVAHLSSMGNETRTIRGFIEVLLLEERMRVNYPGCMSIEHSHVPEVSDNLPYKGPLMGALHPSLIPDVRPAGA